MSPRAWIAAAAAVVALPLAAEWTYRAVFRRRLVVLQNALARAPAPGSGGSRFERFRFGRRVNDPPGSLAVDGGAWVCRRAVRPSPLDHPEDDLRHAYAGLHFNVHGPHSTAVHVFHGSPRRLDFYHADNGGPRCPERACPWRRAPVERCIGPAAADAP